ncbi:DUF6415 family natural product biosynthesis protein [Streptomyces sp. WI04-05B]|uniref:DUF6415 family natural product biosynthesis protein n=1 Tax=Streptomyces TaxID=1883 RepID=UPI0029ACA0F8|nr:MULTISPECIES: DUF6415 family natural product biosynthesis protein [unclassified Streptomyces]MDX2544225.1 DUF6415 family natural product biosynthesis protein [Streptomyces sp. WI04-05B]MDX2584641.1 DUF6415 family natural product biosynthesis protein [Streptomyces sp. WI04-05A]
MTPKTPLPLDVETMRASAYRLLAPDAELPSVDELHTLMLTLKGHLALIIPEVGRVASARRGDDTLARVDARMAISETCRKLRIKPNLGPSSHVAYARRLSRSLNALCDHYENLRGAHPEAGQ